MTTTFILYYYKHLCHYGNLLSSLKIQREKNAMERAKARQMFCLEMAYSISNNDK